MNNEEKNMYQTNQQLMNNAQFQNNSYTLTLTRQKNFYLH